MKNTVLQTGGKWIAYWVNHPKKFFIYSMIFLSLSFIGSLVQGIFYPSESVFKIKVPELYTKKLPETNSYNHEKEMQNIVEELKILKEKRDRQELQRADSLRIEYLYNQYQQLKNGH